MRIGLWDQLNKRSTQETKCKGLYNDNQGRRSTESIAGWTTKSQINSGIRPTSLLLTTTMVNSKNLNKSNKNSTLPPGIQDSSQHVGKSSNSLNLFSRASSRAGKCQDCRK